jgi:hypothetical protein
MFLASSTRLDRINIRVDDDYPPLFHGIFGVSFRQHNLKRLVQSQAEDADHPS